jgi:hypothetical protein
MRTPGNPGRPAHNPAIARLPEAVDDDVECVIVCSEGYPPVSALAALPDIGLLRAGDAIGGYQALLDADVSPI